MLGVWANQRIGRRVGFFIVILALLSSLGIVVGRSSGSTRLLFSGHRIIDRELVKQELISIAFS